MIKIYHLPEKICILICSQILTINSTLFALLVGIATIVLSAMGDFGGGGRRGGSPLKDKGTLKKWLERVADALRRLAGKAAEALPAIIGSVVDAIFSFLEKAIGFLAEHTCALIVFVVGLFGWWLMRRVQRK